MKGEPWSYRSRRIVGSVLRRGRASKGLQQTATGRWDYTFSSCTNATSGHCGGFNMAALAKINKGAGGEPAAFIVARNDNA